jgi:gliding motility associated protien GldN
MKRLFAIVFFGVVFLSLSPQQEVRAQTVDDDIYTKENIPAKEPMSYVHVREADVMWSKKIWQMIDCRKKKNHPLYFPIGKMDDRKSLIQLLLKGIKEEGLVVYDDEQFNEPITPEEVNNALGAGTDTVRVEQPDGSYEKKVQQSTVRYEEIKKYMIREQWYFDRKYSDLRVRIVGICPIREYIDEDTGQKRKRKTFWVYYPAARDLLANWEVFNRENDAQRISFDDWFRQRRFNSFVVKESNVYGNRRVDAYTTGINTLLEAREIRREIFQFEHDLWSY